MDMEELKKENDYEKKMDFGIGYCRSSGDDRSLRRKRGSRDK